MEDKPTRNFRNLSDKEAQEYYTEKRFHILSIRAEHMERSAEIKKTYDEALHAYQVHQNQLADINENYAHCDRKLAEIDGRLKVLKPVGISQKDFKFTPNPLNRADHESTDTKIDKATKALKSLSKSDLSALLTSLLGD